MSAVGEIRQRTLDLANVVRHLEPLVKELSSNQIKEAQSSSREQSPILSPSFHSELETKIQQFQKAVSAHEVVVNEVVQRQQDLDDKLRQVDELEPAVQQLPTFGDMLQQVQELASAVRRLEQGKPQVQLASQEPRSSLSAADSQTLQPNADLISDHDEKLSQQATLRDVLRVQEEADQTLQRVEEFVPALEDTRRQLQELVAVVRRLEPIREKLSAYVRSEIEKVMDDRTSVKVAPVSSDVLAHLEAKLEVFREEVVRQQEDVAQVHRLHQEADHKLQQLEKLAPLLQDTQKQVKDLAQVVDQFKPWREEFSERIESGLRSSMEGHRSELAVDLDRKLEQHRQEMSRRQAALKEALALEQAAGETLKRVEEFAPALEETRREVQQLAAVVARVEPPVERLPESVRREIQAALEGQLQDVVAAVGAGVRPELDAKLGQIREAVEMQQVALQDTTKAERRCFLLEDRLSRLEAFVGEVEEKTAADVDLAHEGIADLCNQLASATGAQGRRGDDLEQRLLHTEGALQGIEKQVGSFRGQLKDISCRVQCAEDTLSHRQASTREQFELLEGLLGDARAERAKEVQAAQGRMDELHEMIVEETAACQKQQALLRERMSFLEAKTGDNSEERAAGRQQQAQMKEQMDVLEVHLG
eukprot:CAMPEP_0115557540 /NCGR_PEP_ID=MMETSP0271-20121206/98965_1 /TAXON_ID=71861 /ORGANISM="Scrippsiella trochoidea, Strain CCMP3099" /LENGTH=648 /DNA_ID=CAMNT_0002991507 /DNA_START=62 /DNA_END=2005 /DNA_ORIENTATION=+